MALFSVVVGVPFRERESQIQFSTRSTGNGEGGGAKAQGYLGERFISPMVSFPEHSTARTGHLEFMGCMFCAENVGHPRKGGAGAVSGLFLHRADTGKASSQKGPPVPCERDQHQGDVPLLLWGNFLDPAALRAWTGKVAPG